jgi:hypothetical protein
MELAVPISLLIGYIGYQFNKNGKVPRDLNVRQNISANNTPTGVNVYNSVSTKVNNQNVQNLANRRFELSKDPVNTNIIPYSYNSSQIAPNDKRVLIKKTVLPSIVEESVQNNLSEMEKSPMFKIPPLNPMGKILDGVEETGGYTPILTEKFDNGVSHLSGVKIENNSINMTPHFGSHVKQNTEPDRNQSLLERYTGISGNEYSINKKAVPTMFDPVKQNIYGHQYIQDRSRINQSNLKTDQVLGEKIQVSPIPAESNRAQYKTTCQLNVKPRTTNKTTDTIQGVNQSQTTRGLIGHVSKNRPETSWKIGMNRSIVGSSVSAPAARENFTNGCGKINESPNNILPAGKLVPSPRVGVRKSTDADEGDYSKESLASLVREDFRNTGHNNGFRNTSGYNKNLSDTTRRSYTARENERDTTSRMSFMPASDTQRGEYLPHNDQAKITMKQTNLFSYTGGAAAENSKHTSREAERNTTRNPARVTIKDYIGNPVDTNRGYTNNSQYENMEIRSNKDTISDLRNYIHEFELGSKMSSGKESVNIRLNDTVQETPNKGFNFTDHSIIPKISGQDVIGDYHVDLNKAINEEDFIERIDDIYVDQLHDNPYAINILN